MNITNRESLNDYHATREQGNINRVYHFDNIRRFLSCGLSSIYTATSQIDGRNGILKGDKVFFKINSEIGVNPVGRIDESMGSCEDVAEVMGFYILRNLASSLGKKSILKTTPYEFADYSHDSFYDIIAKKTNNFVESDRRYGCISKDCVTKGAEIIRGDNLLSLIMPSKEALTSGSNNLYNYNASLGELALRAASVGQEVIIHPICTRYLANTMFWDYFFANNDRHCKNINFQKVQLHDGRFVVEPLPIIDNGAGLFMRSSNCKEVYTRFNSILSKRGSAQSFESTLLNNMFSSSQDFYVGSETYPQDESSVLYNSLKQSEQMVLLISKSRTLYQDFANMYKNLDYEKAINDMATELRFNPEFLPNLPGVTTAILNSRKIEVSKSMASLMGEKFNFEYFDKDANYYLDKFANFTQDDNLNIYIAPDEEVEAFNNAMSLDEESKVQEGKKELDEKVLNDANDLLNSQTQDTQQDSLLQKTNDENVQSQDALKIYTPQETDSTTSLDFIFKTMTSSTLVHNDARDIENSQGLSLQDDISQ